jgi:hypothetical protein
MMNSSGQLSSNPNDVPSSVKRDSVPVSAYSIFVHASPIYHTSDLVTKRSARQGLRPHGRPNRILPLRPDGYPYANRRWSQRLGMSGSTSTGEEAA